MGVKIVDERITRGEMLTIGLGATSPWVQFPEGSALVVASTAEIFNLEPQREPTALFKRFRLRGGRSDGLCVDLAVEIAGRYIDVNGECYYPSEIDEYGRQVFDVRRTCR